MRQMVEGKDRRSDFTQRFKLSPVIHYREPEP